MSRLSRLATTKVAPNRPNTAPDAPAVLEQVFGVQRPEVHQFQRQFIVILQAVDQRGGVDALLVHDAQHQAQKLSVPRHQRVIIGGPRDEVVGQIRAAVRHGRDVVHRQV